jgi:hypothetical protein
MVNQYDFTYDYFIIRKVGWGRRSAIQQHWIWQLVTSATDLWGTLGFQFS